MRDVRVLIADCHKMVLAGLQRLLQEEFAVVGAVSSVTDLLESISRLEPDVVVSDISTPTLDGMDVMQTIRQQYPRVKVVLLTMHGTPELLKLARAVGASGYVTKRDAPEVLFRAIQGAVRGEEFAVCCSEIPPDPPNIAARPEPPPVRVTARQREVLRLVARGWTLKRIAHQLNISPKTVEFHKTALKQHLGVETTAGLIALAVRHGILDEEPEKAASTAAALESSSLRRPR